MTAAIRCVAWLVVWLIGCATFDLILEFQGPWLMFGGMLTYMVADTVDGTIKLLRQ